MKLTQEEKRIKIAEVCGAQWRLFKSGYTWITFDQLRPGFMESVRPNNPSKIIISPSIPDYFNDLNACHEARSKLNSDQKERYVGKLCEFSEMGGYDGFDSLEWCIVNSGAADQAEAFGLTLNLWEAGE